MTADPDRSRSSPARRRRLRRRPPSRPRRTARNVTRRSPPARSHGSPRRERAGMAGTGDRLLGRLARARATTAGTPSNASPAPVASTSSTASPSAATSRPSAINVAPFAARLTAAKRYRSPSARAASSPSAPVRTRASRSFASTDVARPRLLEEPFDAERLRGAATTPPRPRATACARFRWQRPRRIVAGIPAGTGSRRRGRPPPRILWTSAASEVRVRAHGRPPSIGLRPRSSRPSRRSAMRAGPRRRRPRRGVSDGFDAEGSCQVVTDGGDHGRGGARPCGPYGGVRRGPPGRTRDAAVHVAAARERAGRDVHVQHHVADADEVHEGTRYRPAAAPAGSGADAASAAHDPNAPRTGRDPDVRAVPPRLPRIESPAGRRRAGPRRRRRPRSPGRRARGGSASARSGTTVAISVPSLIA